MLAFLTLFSLLGVGLAMDVSSSDDETTEAGSEDAPQEQSRYPDWAARDENATDLLGDAGDDMLVGGPVDSTITGLGGDDVLNGLERDDTIDGGPGDDTIYGATGNDSVIGGPGDDILILGGGNDIVDSPFGTDEMDGNDTIYGQSGNDIIADGNGSNDLRGDNGDDLLIALDGADADGNFGTAAERGTTDTLDGGSGNDTLVGDDGDILTGDGAADFFVVGTHLTSSYVPAPTEFTDFNVDEDVFVVTFLDAPDVEADITFDHDAEADMVRASVNGQVVANMHGLSAEDILEIETAVVV